MNYSPDGPPGDWVDNNESPFNGAGGDTNYSPGFNLLYDATMREEDGTEGGWRDAWKRIDALGKVQGRNALRVITIKVIGELKQHHKGTLDLENINAVIRAIEEANTRRI